MTAEIIAKALGGRGVGGGWIARCPAHEDRKPSLSITEAKGGKVLVRCHAGCEQARVIAALRSRGLWIGNSPRRFTRSAPHVAGAHRQARDEAQRSKAALVIWHSATPPNGTLVATYLISRGLCLPPPPTLRFHPNLKHPSGGVWPGLVALVTRGVDDKPLAIHRTFLARDGQGKASMQPAKMMLGPCAGGAVRLGPNSECIMIAEGIETALSAMQATGQTAWAALSTSGLRALDLPEDVHKVIVLADGDNAGEAAARDCAWRWTRRGRRVRIARPPQGLDFNDMLVGHAPCIEDGAQ
jgi:putative DNA primase/helicase